MADLKYYYVILKPVVTEKSMTAMGEKKYTFYVNPDATKTQVKEAVEKMFEGAKVAKVNTMNLKGKKKRRGMVYGLSLINIQMCIRDSRDALEVQNGDKKCVMEVAQHIGNHVVRCIMLAASEGLHRDMEVTAEGSLSLIHIQMCIRDRNIATFEQYRIFILSGISENRN